MYKQFAITMTLSLALTCGCSKRESKPKEPAVTEELTTVISSPHYVAEVTCYVGEIGSGVNARTTIIDPNKERVPNLTISQSIGCGHTGKVSMISWVFVQHEGGKDIYNFERAFPVDTNGQSTTSKLVEYGGDETIIFQDEYHVVVLDAPK